MQFYSYSRKNFQVVDDMCDNIFILLQGRNSTLGLNNYQYLFDFHNNIYFSNKNYRFEEECKTIEEEQCQTVYDDAWENVCEMVNVTLPATNCREVTRIEMEKKYVYPKLYNLENFNLCSLLYI